MSKAPVHYIVATAGTSGDLHPFMHIALALRALGRQVTFVTNTYHLPHVRAAGLPCVGVGTEAEYLQVLAHPDVWHPQKGFAALLSNYGAQLKEVVGVFEAIAAKSDGPVVVISHPFVGPGAVMARERGHVDAVVNGYLAPSNMRSCHDPLTLGPLSVPRWVPMSWREALWRYGEKHWVDPVGVAQINIARDSLRLPRVRSLLGHIAESPDLSVTLFPTWFAETAPDWPRPMITGDFQMFDARADAAFSPELSAFLAAGEAPVVFTPGTGNVHAAHFFACAQQAVQRLGIRAIFLTKEPAQLPQAPGALPASILWQAYVPLAALLRHTAALIHHGGIGTTAEALRAGVPQLITPFGWDQFDNGARITALGVGTSLLAERLSARRLTGRLKALLSSSAFRERSKQMAGRFAPRPDTVDLCARIEARLAPMWAAPPARDHLNKLEAS